MEWIELHVGDASGRCFGRKLGLRSNCSNKILKPGEKAESEQQRTPPQRGWLLESHRPTTFPNIQLRPRHKPSAVLSEGNPQEYSGVRGYRDLIYNPLPWLLRLNGLLSLRFFAGGGSEFQPEGATLPIYQSQQQDLKHGDDDPERKNVFDGKQHEK